MIKPFKIDIPDKELQNIYTKVKNYPWQSMPNVDHWEYGLSLIHISEPTRPY